MRTQYRVIGGALAVTLLTQLSACGIDFATGAIYLPNGQSAQVDPQELRKVVDAEGKIDHARLKALIEQQTGHSLPLDDPRLIHSSASAEQLAAYGLRPAA